MNRFPSLVLTLCCASVACAQFQVRTTLQPASPSPVGTPVVIAFGHTGTVTGPVTYKLEVQVPGASTFRTVKDFDQQPKFTWDHNLTEGSYTLRVTARDFATANTSTLAVPYQVTSRIVNGQAVVSATSHPLVALFSAPPCPAGSTIQVGFGLQGVHENSYTNSQRCGPGSRNFLVAGMRQLSTYHMNYYVTTNGVITSGPHTLTFNTGAIPKQYPYAPVNLIVPVQAGVTSTADQYQFNSFQSGAQSFAFDLYGNPVWYWPNGIGPEIHRLLSDGTFLGAWGAGGDWTGSGVWGNQTQDQIIAQFDMLGNALQETNVDRVNEQLPPAHPITHFNHDSLRLPNGHTLVIADTQQLFPAGTQGSQTPIGIIAMAVVELDGNFQVVWYWNAFDHDGGGSQLDINRQATLHDQCTGGVQGCPPVQLTDPSNDWLHANTLQLEPDGSLVISLRNQDWVIAVDYANGTGTGNILWRMGREGDFKMQTNTVSPWFTHQHDTEFQAGAQTLLTVFDNGNKRVAANGSGNSRGQVLNVDIPNKTVSLALNLDLGVFSGALGSAQVLSNGNYLFGAGEIYTGHGAVNQCIEATPAGVIALKAQVDSVDYRCTRVPDLYSSPNGSGINVEPQ